MRVISFGPPAPPEPEPAPDTARYCVAVYSAHLQHFVAVGQPVDLERALAMAREFVTSGKPAMVSKLIRNPPPFSEPSHE